MTRTWVRCILRQKGPSEHQGTASAFPAQVPPGLVVKPWSELAHRVGGVWERVRKAGIIHWDLRNLKFKAPVKTNLRVYVCPLSKRALVFKGANLSVELLVFKIVVPRSITHTEFVKPERGHNVTAVQSSFYLVPPK